MKNEVFTYKLEDLDAVAQVLLGKLSSKTILIYGEMGSGKTTLVKSLSKALGSTDEVSSPTFSIVNEYESESNKIYHFDLYRIEHYEEAYDFGIEDYFDSGEWLFLEWPDRISELLPEDAESLEIVINIDNTRSLKLNNKLINLTENYAEHTA